MNRSAWGLDTDVLISWHGQAACRSYDPEWWSVTGTKLSNDNKLAQRICAGCPVRERCKAEGVEQGVDATGMIYGGEVMPVRVHTPGPLSTRQAAALANCASTTIRAALDEGKLWGQRTDKGWEIDPAALAEYVRGRRG